MSAGATYPPDLVRAPAPVNSPESPFPFWDFLLEELTPYPGRISVVIRMVFAATITMLCIMVGHLPEGALGAYFALTITRDSLRASFGNAVLRILFFGLATLYILVGAALFLASPFTHFLWIIGSLFLLFFVMSAGSSYSLTSAFALLVTAALPTWDRPYSVNTKISLTLYLFFALAIGTLSGLLVEAVYRTFNTTDPILTGLSGRLRVSAAMLMSAAEGREPDKNDQAKLRQYAMTGSSALRRQLTRSAQHPNVRARVSGAIALNERLVELCAAALHDAQIRGLPDAEDARRLSAVAAAVQARAAEPLTLPGLAAIGTSTLPRWTPSDAPSDALPTLPEIEEIVVSFGQILESFENASAKGDRAREALQEYGTVAERRAMPQGKLWKPDAFTNREHLVFALRGTLAATLCYLIYTGVSWPGIDTALRTCTITALSTIGSSRQKQALRITGAVVGGFFLALPAQVYLLPHLDSITGFTLFFAVATLIVSWLATTSSRLSYFGLQAALAFYLVNLGEPYEQVSLSISRDRVFGVLLGLVAMWLVFDRIGAKDATSRMQELLQTNLRLLGSYGSLIAQLLEGGSDNVLRRALELKDQINDAFSQMNSQADAVLFEFGPRRSIKLRARARMQAMQPAMRSIFLAELALIESDDALKGARSTNDGWPALAVFLSNSNTLLESFATLPSSGAVAVESASEKLQEALSAIERESETMHRSAYRLCLGMAQSLATLREQASNAETRTQ